jgi:alcohol dehydrogenase class IV
MNLTSFSFPTRILYGAGAIREIRPVLNLLGVRRPLVVTDAGFKATTAFASLVSALEGEATGAAPSGFGWSLHADVHANPAEADVRGAAASYVKGGCDGIIAIGGGSPLDAGKAARLLVKRPGFELAHFYAEPDWSGLAPLVAIPTTAGTGSEVGRSSVITLDSTRRKAVLFNPELLAKLVILDPELTLGLPPKLTAATGADALTHCIESFTCPVFHPMCDGISLEAIRLIADALPRAYRDGSNVDARGRMLVAATMGGVAFQKDLGVVHSLAHPLSTLCGLHHGLANALCLVAGMRFCSARKPGIYRRIGEAFGLGLAGAQDPEADTRTISLVAEFLRGLGLASRLSEHGVSPARLDELADQAFADPCHPSNVVPVTRDDLRALYVEVM